MSAVHLLSFELGREPVFSAIGDGHERPADGRDASARPDPSDSPQPEEVVA